MQLIVEGLDRLGKDSLIKNILHEFGYHSVIHYSKPVFPNPYSTQKKKALQEWQIESFVNGFDLCMTGANIIFNRFHLGENVYADRYRGYPGDYVFEIEQSYNIILSNIKMILLWTDNFEFQVDDGDSFDFSKREAEMQDFIKAFKKSQIKNKIMINVHNGKGGYKTHEEINNEVFSFLRGVDDAKF